MPGLPNMVGTLNVRGNLVFTSAATYLININAVTASQANVTGIAALNGATVQVVDDRNITKRQVYTLLTATGGVNGTFNPDVIGVKNKVDLFYDANHVYLCDHCKLTDLIAQQLPFFPGSPGSPGSPASLPGDVNQIAGAIDAAIDANITLPTRFANLLGLALQPQQRPQLVNALGQLTGEVHTGAEQQASSRRTRSCDCCSIRSRRRAGRPGSVRPWALRPRLPRGCHPRWRSPMRRYSRSPRRRRSPPLPAAPGTSGPRVMAAAPISAAIR
jgi:hypothetical protein